MTRTFGWQKWLVVALLGASATVWAHGEPSSINNITSDERPEKLQGVGIDEKLGTNLDFSLRLRDETGAEVTLGSFFDGKTPVILSPVYFSCPGLCNFHLNGLTEALKDVDWTVGSQYQVLAISFDPKETPDLAAKKKENYLKIYGRPGSEKGWHFLTGDAETLRRLTDSVGFKYRWNETEKEWAHASAAILVSPVGVVTRYLPGIQFEGKDVRLGLLEASQGKIGTFIDQLILYCFQYNPHQSKFTIYAFNIMKLGGAFMVLVLALWLVPAWLRTRRDSEQARSA